MKNILFILLASLLSLPIHVQEANAQETSGFVSRLDSVLIDEGDSQTKIESLYDDSLHQLVAQVIYVADISKPDHWRKASTVSYQYDEDGNVIYTETITFDKSGNENRTVKRFVSFGSNTSRQTIDEMIAQIIEKNKGQIGGEGFDKENGIWDD